MVKYKSIVTDYEGMQAQLDMHAAQGWRLFSVTPDTWRKSTSTSGNDSAPFDELSTSTSPTQEYSASYYLVIFERDEYIDVHERAASAEESFPRFFEG
jgi:hypothetical protein